MNGQSRSTGPSTGPILNTWSTMAHSSCLNTDPLMEEKYRRRVDKVKAINDKHCVPVK